MYLIIKEKKLIFLYDLKLWSFFKMKHWIYKEFVYLYVYSIMIYKKMWCIETIITIFTTICKRFHSKIHLHEKIIFEWKDVQFLSKIMVLVHFILFGSNVHGLDWWNWTYDEASSLSFETTNFLFYLHYVVDMHFVIGSHYITWLKSNVGPWFRPTLYIVDIFFHVLWISSKIFKVVIIVYKIWQ